LKILRYKFVQDHQISLPSNFKRIWHTHFEIFSIKVHFFEKQQILYLGIMTSRAHISNFQKKIIFHFWPNAIINSWKHAYQFSQGLKKWKIVFRALQSSETCTLEKQNLTWLCSFTIISSNQSIPCSLAYLQNFLLGCPLIVYFFLPRQLIHSEHFLKCLTLKNHARWSFFYLWKGNDFNSCLENQYKRSVSWGMAQLFEPHI